MSFSQSVQLPDWTRINALFNPDQMQILHNQAMASDQAPQAALLQNQTAQQNLDDRSTLRGLVSGLAGRDPTALATAASLPVGVGGLNALTSRDASLATQQLGLYKLLGGLPTMPYGAATGGVSAPLTPNPLISSPGGDDAFINRMGGAESGNRAGVVNPQGYAGQYQFGAPRLQELGVYQPAQGEISEDGKWTNGQLGGQFSIPGFPQVQTKADFLRNPDAQRAVMHLQVKDLSNVIANTPGADQFDRTGLIAVGHLGGAGGIARFVASGGQDNPADVNGTTLAAYYNRFKGNPAGLQQAAGHPQGPLPGDHPVMQMPAYQVASAAPQTATDATSAAPATTFEDVQRQVQGYRDGTAPAQTSGMGAGPAMPPAQQQAAPQEVSPNSSLPPGAKMMTNRLTGLPFTEGAPAGYAWAQMPDRSPVAVPLVQQPLNFQKTPTAIIGSDPRTGKVVSTTPTTEQGRVTFVDTPQGKQGYINGHVVGEPIAFSGRDAQIKAYTEDQDKAKAMTQVALQAQSEAPRLNEMADLARQLETGPTADVRAKAQAYLETAGVDPASAARITGVPSAAAAQEFTKLALATAGGASKADLGANNGIQSIELYRASNPNMGLMQDANVRITNMLRVANQAKQDYAAAGLTHFGANENNLLGTDGKGSKAYTPLTSFDRNWIQQNNPHVYSAAMGMLNGDGFDKWSARLSDPAEGARAAAVVAKIDPNAMIQVKGGAIRARDLLAKLNPQAN